MKVSADLRGKANRRVVDVAATLKRFGCGEPQALIGRGTVVRYERSGVISSDDLGHLHLILEGAVQIMHYAASGRAVLVHEYGAGQPFGGYDVIGDVHNQAIAKGVVTALRFRGLSILDAARADPGFGLTLLAQSLSVTSSLARRLIELTVERARDRVRLEVVRLARRNMLDAGTGLIEHPPTHADLAAQVGSHREEVTREMSSLKQLKLIEKNGNALLVRVDLIEKLNQRKRSRPLTLT